MIVISFLLLFCFGCQVICANRVPLKREARSQSLNEANFKGLGILSRFQRPANVYELIDQGSLDQLRRVHLSVQTLCTAEKSRKFSPLEYSIILKKNEVFSFQLEALQKAAFMDICQQICSLVAFAIKCGNLPALRLLLEKFGRRVFVDQELLTLAAHHNASMELLGFLFEEVGLKDELEASADPITTSIAVNLLIPFCFFALRAQSKLTQYDAKIKTTPLLFLLQRKRLRMLLDAVDCIPTLKQLTDADSNTLLHMIAFAGVPGITKKLSEAGADLNAKNVFHRTPLQMIFIDENGGLLRSFSPGKQRVFAELLEAGASIFDEESGCSVFSLILGSRAMWSIEHILKTGEAQEFINRAKESRVWWLAEGLLRLNVDVDVDAWPVDWSEIVESDCYKCLQRIQIEEFPPNLMQQAVQQNASEIIAVLENRSVDVNDEINR